MSPQRPDHERIPRPDRAPKPPDGWVSLDAEVDGAREFTCRLHADHRKAQDAARAAAEALAQAERDDRSRRSAAVAAGKPDPGRATAQLTKAEREATEAAERREVLAEAVAASHAQLEATIAERSTAWQEAARKAVDRAGIELRAAVETVGEAFGVWREAQAQLVLAVDERSRRKGGLRGDTTLRLPQDPSVVDVLAAMVALTVPPAQVPESEERTGAPAVA